MIQREDVDTSREEITHLWACYLERAQQTREGPYPHQQPPEPHAEWYERTANALRALLDRAERAEAERDAAFAAGQDSMRERAIGETTPTGAEDATRERIRALPILPRP